MKKRYSIAALVAAVLLAVLFLRQSAAYAQTVEYGAGAPGPEVNEPPTLTATEAAAALVNGDFELGNLSGWGAYSSSSQGGWFAYTGTTAPRSGYTIAAPPQGTWAATSDQLGGSVNILYRDLVLDERFALKLALYYANRAGVFFSPNTLDPYSTANQQYRVDIMRPSASLLSVAPADILLNVFQTKPGDPLVLPPAEYRVDLSPFAGQTVRLRFAQVCNIYFFQASVDDVRLVPRTDEALELLEAKLDLVEAKLDDVPDYGPALAALLSMAEAASRERAAMEAKLDAMAQKLDQAERERAAVEAKLDNMSQRTLAPGQQR